MKKSVKMKNIASSKTGRAAKKNAIWMMFFNKVINMQIIIKIHHFILLKKNCGFYLWFPLFLWFEVHHNIRIYNITATKALCNSEMCENRSKIFKSSVFLLFVIYLIVDLV